MVHSEIRKTLYFWVSNWPNTNFVVFLLAHQKSLFEMFLLHLYCYLDRNSSPKQKNCVIFIYFYCPDNNKPLHLLLPQIISSAVVLGVSLALGAVSLMGLSQGDREQVGYEALSRAAVSGINDELRAPADLEDQQQQQEVTSTNSPTCSINSRSTALFLSLILKHLSFSNLVFIPRWTSVWLLLCC